MPLTREGLRTYITDRSATSIFQRLAREDDAVNDSLVVRSFRAGDTVCEAEELGRVVCLVLQGRLRLLRRSHLGRSYVAATVGPGSVLGEESLLDIPHRPTTAVALEPCTVWLIAAHRAREMSATNPMFCFGLVQAVGQRVLEAEDRLAQTAYSTIASRLAALLLELAADKPGDEVQITHYELAEMLGTWRETVSKALQRFRRRGLVASGHRRLLLLDRAGLEMEASGYE